MALRIPWCRDEALILLEALIKVLSGECPRKQAVIDVSETLRKRATGLGIRIDNVFRNFAGINLQMGTMEYILTGGKQGINRGEKLFKEVVDLYKNQRFEFEKALSLAKLSVEKPVEGIFLKWLTQKVGSTKLPEYIYIYEELQNYFIRKKIIEEKLLEIIDIKIIKKLLSIIKLNSYFFNYYKYVKFILALEYYHEFLEEYSEIVKSEEEKEPFKKEAIKSAKLVEKNIKLLDYDRPVKIVSDHVQKGEISQMPVYGQQYLRPTSVKDLFRQKVNLENKHLENKSYGIELEEVLKDDNKIQNNLNNIVQSNWIKLNSTNYQDFKYTSPVYCALKDKDVTDKNWIKVLIRIVELEISKKNPAIAELYKAPLLLKSQSLNDRPFIMKRSIPWLNCSKLSNGYWVNVNYNIPNLMKIIRSFCLRCGYKEKQILIYGVAKEKKLRQTTINTLINTIERHLKPLELNGANANELINVIKPKPTMKALKDAIDKSSNIICLPSGKYIHKDSLIDFDEAGNKLWEILEGQFAQFDGYSNKNLLFGAAEHELSMFLNDNGCKDADTVYSLAEFLFKKIAYSDHKCEFYNPHIFELGQDYPPNLQGLMKHLAKNNNGLLEKSKTEDFLQKAQISYQNLNQIIQVNNSEDFLMYDSSGKYLSSEVMNIDNEWCQKMHDLVDNLFRQENVAYIILRDIAKKWLNILPALPNGLAWTPLLLQEVIKKYKSIGFKTISPDLRQIYGTLATAIIPNDSPLQSFPDVVWLYMNEKKKLPVKMAKNDFWAELKEAGMIAGNELKSSLPKALHDYRFNWLDGENTVIIRKI